MKVEKVNYNSYYRAPQNALKSEKHTPSFKGGGAVTHGELVKELKHLLPFKMRFVSKMADNIGEVQNIIINSLGTGLVAPIFIKYNPLSKTDEDTRTYSAWRQPISAVLAVATQAGMVAPFNTYISNMSFAGEYGENFNMSNFKDKKYIKKLIKKAEPHLTKDQLEKRVQEELDKQSKELKDNIKYNNRIMLKSPNEVSKPLSEKAYNNTILDTIETLIKNDEKKLQSCDTKASKRLIRSEFLSQKTDEVKTVLEEVKTQIEGSDNLTSIKKYLSGKIKQLKAEKADENMIAMVKEIKDRIKQISTPKVDGKPVANISEIIKEELLDKTKKMLAQTEKYATIKDKDAIEAEVNKSVAERKEAFNKSLKTLNEIKAKLAAGEKITAGEIDEIIKSAGKDITFKDSSLHSDFIAEMIAKYKDNIKSNLKGHKQFTGLIISLAVLPITCCLLNWVYPRFMDAIFPNLSNKKHDNESRQLVEQAPKKAGGAA